MEMLNFCQRHNFLLSFVAATVTKVFPKVESSKINGILGDFLKKNRTRSGRKSDD